MIVDAKGSKTLPPRTKKHRRVAAGDGSRGAKRPPREQKIWRRPAGLAVISIVALGAGVSVGFLAYTALTPEGSGGRADPANAQLVAVGSEIYGEHCAVCHGGNLEGQPNWRSRRPDGRLPAPPHDKTGHTWHHPDWVLFEVTKRGVEAFGVRDYESDMPAFDGVLTDEQIWAVLAYIKSRWPAEIQEAQADMTERTRR